MNRTYLEEIINTSVYQAKLHRYTASIMRIAVYFYVLLNMAFAFLFITQLVSVELLENMAIVSISASFSLFFLKGYKTITNTSTHRQLNAAYLKLNKDARAEFLKPIISEENTTELKRRFDELRQLNQIEISYGGWIVTKLATGLKL